MKVLVTGSHGFLGSAFVTFLETKKIPYVRYDRSNPKSSRGFDAVVHFGGLTPFSPKGISANYQKANVQETKKLLASISKNKTIRCFVNIGSAAEYGTSEYGKSKLAQSELVKRFAKKWNIRAFTLRLFNVMGAPGSIFDTLSYQFRNFNGTIEVSNGKMVRDFVDVKDINQAVYAALLCQKTGYHSIDICSGHGTTLAELVTLFGKEYNKKYRLENKSNLYNSSIGSPIEAKRLLGWKAKTPLRVTV